MVLVLDAGIAFGSGMEALMEEAAEGEEPPQAVSRRER